MQWKRGRRRSSGLGRHLNDLLPSEFIVEKPKRSQAPGQDDEQADEQNRRQRLPPQVENDHQANRSDDVVNGVFVHLHLSEGRLELGDSAARQYRKGQSQR